MITPAISLASLAIAAGVLSFTYWQLLLCRRQTRILNSHRIAATSAVQKSRMDLVEVRNRARLLEDTVSSGASAVEKLHRSISNTTFGLIDLFSRDEAFQQNARNAQKTHDQTSQQIYRAVRTTNKALHILADTLIISKAEKKIVSRKTVSKKAPRER